MRKGNQTADPQPTTTLTESQFIRSHQVEEDVRRQLLNDVSLHISDLVVRRVPGGVCLEGYLEMDGDLDHVCCLAQRVAGVEKVLNRLITCSSAPRKG